MRLLSLLLIAALAAGGFLWWRTSHQPAPIAPERIIEPTVGNIVRGVIAVGRVEPRTRLDLKSKANGIIRKLQVDVSDPVRAGQTIVELDQEILRAGVNEAEGKLQSARGALESSKAAVKRLEVEKGDPEIEYATRNWERAQKLHGGGLLSDDERDQARDRNDKAQYRLRLLDAQIVSARADQVSAEGKLREVEAQADLARQELAEATIVSPIDGVVLHRYLEEGDSVSSIRVAGGNASTIMTLGDLSELYIDAQVDEVDAGKIIDQQQIRPNLEARVRVESFKERTFRGRVTRIAQLGLEDSNGIVTFEIRITLQNPEKLLLANMTANSQIVLEDKANVLRLSQGAIITEKEARFAMVYNPATGGTELRKVVAGISDGSLVEIKEGLEAGQKVVLP